MRGNKSLNKNLNKGSLVVLGHPCPTRHPLKPAKALTHPWSLKTEQQE